MKMLIDGKQVVKNIELILLQKKMPKAEFYKKAQITSATFSNWRTGAYDPSYKTLVSVANALGVPLDAITGASPEAEKAPTASSEGNGEVNQLPAGAMPVPEGEMIPILGEVRCGIPIYAEQNVIGYTNYAGNYGEEYYALRATGDSMNGVGINPGDLVIVRKQPIVDQNDIAVVCVNGNEATLKRFTQRGDMVILSPQSTNPDNKPLIYNLRETPVHVMGRVMEVRKTF